MVGILRMIKIIVMKIKYHTSYSVRRMIERKCLDTTATSTRERKEERWWTKTTNALEGVGGISTVVADNA